MNSLIETNRLILRVFEDGDVEETKNFWGDGDVMNQCAGPVPHEVLPKVIDSYRKCHEVKGLSMYAVVEKESGRVIGGAGFNVRDSVETCELLYHYSKEAWGKGYATEAAVACLTLAKQTGKVQTVYASADPQNQGSLKILEKIGMTYKGMKWFEDTNQEEPYFEIHF